MDLEAGVVVAQRYRIQRQLGRGGMGEVFAAENIRTGRIVAVKVLRADSKQKSSAVARFRREARAAGAINSDHVTQVLDVEEDAEHGIVIVFELLEGESLIERLKRTGPMTFDELFPVVEGVWMGLTDAHKSGVIHRDLKPSNVFLERRPDGTTRVKILDFGISKLPKEVGGDTLTEMGQSLGTFSFMPPEQIGKAKTVDHRADIYACATLIYQAMSGQLPYAAKNILQMVDLKTKSEPRPLSAVLDGPVDPRLEAFLQKALARDPENRFSSAQEALDVWRELRHSSSSGPILAGAAAPGYPQQQAQPPHPAPGYGPPSNAQPGRSPATVMMNDPRATGGGQPYPYASPQSGAGSAQRKSLGGTVAIADQRSFSPQPFPAQPYTPAPGTVPKVSGVPVVNDTTSEGGGDHVATIAIPRGAMGLSPGGPGSGLPRMHEDRGQSGTQLMSHAVVRAAGMALQPHGPPTSPGGAAQPSHTPMPGTHASGLTSQQSLHQSSSQIAAQPHAAHHGGQGQQGQPQQGQPQQGQPQQGQPQQGQPQQGQPQQGQVPAGENADLTTVYRRDKAAVRRSAPVKGRGLMVVGIIVFAIVGFAIAALVLRYVRPV